ncbi:MAG: Arm DNA-binding domain-containing protein, partial [Proteobacteria bacterium]|nr:Arm DNA-binding domain-containing protein [Pseudomonadota bacterium]
MATQLTYVQIAKTTKPGRYFDGGTGLHLLVKSATKKYWVFRFKFNGARQDMGLGVFPRVSLAEARRAAQEARVMLDSDINPLQKKKADKVATVATEARRITFKQFALECVEAKRPEW